MMVVTSGKSRPRAATSVHMSTPRLHRENPRKVFVRTPCTHKDAQSSLIPANSL